MMKKLAIAKVGVRRSKPMPECNENEKRLTIVEAAKIVAFDASYVSHEIASW